MTLGSIRVLDDADRDALLRVVDAVGLQGERAVLDEVEVDVPVDAAPAPGADREDPGVVVHGDDAGERGGLGLHARRLLRGLQQGALGEVAVAVVRDLELQIDAAQILAGEVRDVGVHEVAVRYRDALVVHRQERGVEDADLADAALGAAGVDVVADAEGLEDQDHQPAGEIAERALQREADGEAAGGDDRGDGGHRDAEDRDHADDQHDVEHDVDEASEEALDRRVQLGEAVGLRQTLADQLDDQTADDQHDDREDDLAADRRSHVHTFFEEFFHGLAPSFFRSFQLKTILLF